MQSIALFSSIMQWLPPLLWGLLVTIQVAILASLLGICAGIFLGVLQCKKLKTPIIGRIIEAYVLVIRGTPSYVQILIVYYALPDLLGVNLSPFVAGALALGLNMGAYVSEIVRAGIDALPAGQWLASMALGYSQSQAVLHIILPQGLKNVLPALVSEVVIVLKETSLLSMIGLLEMTRVGINIIARSMQPMTIYLLVACLYLAMTTIIDMIGKKIEKGLAHD